MCDICSDFTLLLESYEARIISNDAKYAILLKSEIETAFGYIQAWPQRQCMCLYRDGKNFERFNLIIQSMICLAVHHLKYIKRLIEEYKNKSAAAASAASATQQQQQQSKESATTDKKDENVAASETNKNDKEAKEKVGAKDSKETNDGEETQKENEKQPISDKTAIKSSSCQQTATASSTACQSPATQQHTEERWLLEEVEKLLVLVSKVFLLNFPLYIAYKHGTHARLDDISAEEAQHLAIFCELHDNEIPVYLLRNISLFCNSNGFAAMMVCFDQPDLPVTTAHAIITTVSNIKLWLNYGCMVQLFIPLRSKVLQYMCKLSDHNLRTASARAMADFIWSSVRDPLDPSVSFDVEGLALAFKYFTSTTLTMRLAGITQINAHINIFGEIEAVGEVEVVAQKIAHWLTENQIIQHLFGPNLHVEVIKQAHIVLNFLAVENQITEEHIKLIWQATQQLKHCSKTIFDILPSLVKNLAPKPAMYLYTLLCRMDPKEHTEQSIYIASALTKLIWSRDKARSQMSLEDELMAANATASSASESGSMDASNSDEGNGDDSSLASTRKSPIDIENVCSSDTGVTPCKQARRRRHVCDPTEEKGTKLSEEELNILNAKMDMKLKNHRIVNIVDNSSSDDEHGAAVSVHRKKSRKRRKPNNNSNSLPLTRLAYEIVEAICDGGDDDEEASSDDVDDGDGELLNDSDDCCSDPDQVPTAVLKHLQGEGPYIRAIAETHISELLSGAENEGSYSSPMSNKSEKNLGDFDDEDVSCEEEIAQLVSSHNCMPQALAAAAAAMAAHITMQKKQEANVAAAAAAVAAAAVASGSARQSLLAIHQQANAAVAMAKAVSQAGALASQNVKIFDSKHNPDTDLDISAGSLVKDSGSSSKNVSSSSSTQQPTFRINDVCQPGNTLLWDLLQDDKIGQLGESLALEAEKALATLLCFSNDRQLRTKFIEGCLQNLANNKSIIVSLRLLPKLFASFQQFRPSDTHHVTLWAERQHKMMYHFFNNIKHYNKKHMEMLSNKESNNQQYEVSPLYSHKTQVSVRLQFLSSIFSSMGSPKTFRLTLEQVDALWEWLSHDPECCDCYFSWLQSQAKGGDQHALGLEALQHLYLKKLPELRPEEFSMVALGLFQQLCSLARMAIAHYEKQTDSISTNSSNIVGMFHLWKIALRAHNTEVSLAAIQYINMYYMGQQLRLEKEFVSQCMDNLSQAASALESVNEDENAFMCVQRGLMLLNTHLETFRRRYAFHLRRWAIEGQGIGSHSNLKNEASGSAIRIILQPAGLSEKSVLHMHACDLIADLKAEISKWWENLQGTTNSGVSAPVLGLLLSEGPLRIITQGQELSSEYDERSLGDAGFKDNQIVYVSLGGRGARRKETNIEHPSMQPPPPKECLPTVLLLQPKYFEKLFSLMQTLGDMKPQPNNLQLHTKAQLLSRRVWDILAILPTNPMILDTFKGLTNDLTSCEQLNDAEEEQTKKRKEIKDKLCELLDPSNLQKFMYSLHIVESLALNSVFQQRGGSASCCSGINGSNIQPMMEPGSKSSSASKSKKSQCAGNSSCGAASSTSCSGSSSVAKRRNSTSQEDKDDSNAEQHREKDVCSDSPSQKEINSSNSLNTMLDNSSEHSDQAALSSTDKESSSPLKCNKKQKKSDCTTSHSTSHTSSSNNNNMEIISATTFDTKWSDTFIKCGGLKHLYDIFISGKLQQSSYPKELLNEWRHDCLASLLRILWLMGFEEDYHEDMLVSISKPKDFMLQMMTVDDCLKRLSSILNDEAYANYLANTSAYHHLRTGFWGRAQVVQFAMNIMVSFVHASADARKSLWAYPDYCNWVQKFILDDPEPAVRREICAGLYRICLGNTQSHQLLLAPLLRKLISFLSVAEKMTTYSHHNPYMLTDDGKEPYGPACRDYFWLLARLVDTLSPEMIKTSLETTSFFNQETEDAIDIEKLCQSVAQSILTRDYYETRYGMQDDGLVGLINLMSNLVKYDPTFKYSSKVIHFIEQIFEFLFDMPSPNNRQKPKCKSATSRAAAYDLLVELCKNCPKNYTFLHNKLLAQHTPGPKPPYPWDYWPRDEGRSECGYVGLTNLGATCYMASCIQHLYMMPQARAAILRVPGNKAQKHAHTLLELQRMFAYLLESERKAYNPRSFCRVYQMDHQPLNTGEQKDMAEFFIDLVSKLEEMTSDLKDLVKRLFCGTLSNNVVSLDCDHVSRTAEEFYTVRCQVADMRNLQESLDEVTVKDTLEGDNMYTCSQCGKKVRAEKRACFKKLPQILCFNTMRYTFNMVTMLKEKVNTHFSFPMRLNMSDYVEKTLMPHQYKEDREKRKKERDKALENADELLDDTNDDDLEDCLEYELVGVTVHTGTADGGHYYSFIKERNKSVIQHDRWFLFNDAEVKPFDPSQIAAECFGGEMTSKTYDSVTEKYLDFSFEKTNSAYMLFYERRLPDHLKEKHANLLASQLPIQQKPITKIPTNSLTTNTQSRALDKLENSAKAKDENDSTPDAAEPISSKDKEAQQATKETKKDETEEEKKETTTTICDKEGSETTELLDIASTSTGSSPSTIALNKKIEILLKPQLSKELEDWIWQDNRQFLQDRNIFEHTYFNFMWQICGHIPQTLISQQDVTCMAAKLSVSFFIETFIHAKEKPTMVPWVELLTKQFNISQEACEWFLTHMSLEPWWPVQVLIQCPNQMVRQMFQRLVIHVIQRLRSTHSHLYLKTENDDDGKEMIGVASCITRFISSLILLMEHGAKAHLRNLSEFFGLLFEFSRMGDEETVFLLKIGIIKSVADFYLGNKTHDNLEANSDNEDNSSDEALSVDKTRPASLDKMIALVANLVERSRGQDLRLKLSPRDYNAIAGGKGFPFLYQQIKDNINSHQTKHLIHALCRWDERLASQIISMLFASVTKHTELCGPFFKLLTLLTETQGGPSGLPCFSQLVLQRVWDAAEYCPQSALDWLAFQAPKNKIAHAWILQSAETWVEQYLMAHHNSRVRNAAAFLLVSLVPSQQFRANFRTHSLHKLSSSSNHVCRELSNDAQIILHNIINLLLRLLKAARAYADIGVHGTTKLTSYFSLLGYCMVSKTEKVMMGPYMRVLWDLFHPRLSEPSVPAHHNKHALLAFWHHTIQDCPENALIVANCPEITRNIAFNYILADHDDSEIVAYNRAMLPAYYGLLRLCCEQSRTLTRQLAAHQNLQWAFKNITPHPTQYTAAVDELFKLMILFATRHPDASEQEKHEVTTFRRTTLSAYLTGLEARVSWGTLINALRILVDNDEDRLLVIYNGGIEMCFDALHTLHSMHHEATACHVSGDLQELLSEMVLLLSTLRLSTRLDSPINKKQQLQLEQQAQQLQQQQQLVQKQYEQLKQQSQQQQSQHTTQQSTSQQQQQQQQHKERERQLQQQMQALQLQQMQHQLHQQHFLRQHQQHTALLKGLPDAVKRLATFLNTYNPPEICRLSLEVLKELVRNPNLDVTSILAPILINCHLSVASAPQGPLGPYFPRRVGVGKATWPAITKNTPRPPRPMVQMCIPHSELLHRGVDLEHDAQVEAFYKPYHDFIDVMLRMAVNTNQLNDTLVKLSCLLAIEAAPLHFNLFPKFWVGIYNNKSTNKYAELLINNQYLVEYIHIILRDCRVSLSDQYIRAFLEIYYTKISSQLPIARLLYSISYSMHSKEDLDDLCGDLFAIRVIAQFTGIPTSVRKQLRGSLKALLYKSARYQEMELFSNKKLKLDNNESKETTTTTTTTTKTDTANTSANNDDDKVKSPIRTPQKDDKSEKMDVVDNEESENKSKESEETNEENDKKDLKNMEEIEEVSKKKEEVEESVDKTTKETEKSIEMKENEKHSTEDVSDEKKTAEKDTAKTPEEEKQTVKDECTSFSKPQTTTTTLNKDDIPSTSAAAAAAAVAAAADACAASTTKQVNKKTAEDRLREEHEKRIKLLLTMETYIKSILALMQKDETNTTSPTTPPPTTSANTVLGSSSTPHAHSHHSLQSQLDESMEREQNTTPVPESSDEGGGNGSGTGESGFGKKSSKSNSAFHVNYSATSTRTSSVDRHNKEMEDELEKNFRNTRSSSSSSPPPPPLPTFHTKASLKMINHQHDNDDDDEAHDLNKLLYMGAAGAGMHLNHHKDMGRKFANIDDDDEEDDDEEEEEDEEDEEEDEEEDFDDVDYEGEANAAADAAINGGSPSAAISSPSSSLASNMPQI